MRDAGVVFGVPFVLLGVKSSFLATLAAVCIPVVRGVGGPFSSSGEGAKTLRFCGFGVALGAGLLAGVPVFFTEEAVGRAKPGVPIGGAGDFAGVAVERVGGFAGVAVTCGRAGVGARGVDMRRVLFFAGVA